jgi:hypothetical protein
MKPTGRGLLVACLAPSVITGCLLVGGERLLWPHPALTAPEAVLLRNAGEASARFLAGADPDEPARAAVGVPRGTPPFLTPLEAAVRSGERRMIELVLHHGATLDAESGLRLACIADGIGEQQIASWLSDRLQIVIRCE